MPEQTRCNAILIVEDDLHIRETLQTLLELEGYSVFAACNGQEGLDLLEQIPTPCLILLDLLMPVMNGMEFLEAKNRNDTLGSIPVCIVTGVMESKIPGTVGYMKKPVSFDALLNFVKQYCGSPPEAKR